MISAVEAQKIVMDNLINLGDETVYLESSVNRVLAENIYADRNFPPFDRVMMDGIAILFEEYSVGKREFEVQGMQTAGIPRMSLTDPQNCFEVMTGAILPKNTDTVIKFEDCDINDGIAKIKEAKIVLGQHIHSEGSDRKEGDLLLAKAIHIGPAEIAVLSTVGKAQVRVKENPSVAIVSTGDELVDVSETPMSYQIRTSNSQSVKSQLHINGIDASTYHLIDDKEGLKSSLKEIIKNHNIVILSGGVSRGKKDYVPEVLDDLEVQKLFHKVLQRPGKPFWFGRNSDTVVFALPGNPVSTFMCFHKYTLPFINSSLGIESKLTYAKLSSKFEFSPNLTYFLQVKLEQTSNGEIIAHPVPGQGSGDLANLVDADAFMELTSEKSIFNAGEVYPVLRY